MSNIKWFTTTGQRKFAPKASIWTGGFIRINAPAMTDFELTNYDFAQLGFDEEGNRVAVRFTNDKDSEGLYKVIRGKEKTSEGVTLSAKAFLNHFRINFEKKRECSVSFDEKEKILFIQL